ncbi:MAG: hypothetical protein A2722_00145 [Candidatus Doudnabacteria bacterium RIFCSPHIGHO2_01_FULL_50_11]|uniref:Uncharacterized protein n=1 Tax=Candidatus Doudnabacteria bacterium RIFCSPHIGHO2_01_FULL_50_11 TaxID=1817828 RepID=A0A1F5PHJ9_9BACT|nr:MAG: hypothetical protein A2722_00145 [Candidatus Doudnabacteria bacterium RIFCSPHIGHO2_01_FULL_50_11]HLC44219.1 hypothetical protein [Patescibacteria group bacterium]
MNNKGVKIFGTVRSKKWEETISAIRKVFSESGADVEIEEFPVGGATGATGRLTHSIQIHLLCKERVNRPDILAH